MKRYLKDKAWLPTSEKSLIRWWWSIDLVSKCRRRSLMCFNKLLVILWLCLSVSPKINLHTNNIHNTILNKYELNSETICRTKDNPYHYFSISFRNFLKPSSTSQLNASQRVIFSFYFLSSTSRRIFFMCEVLKNKNKITPTSQ